MSNDLSPPASSSARRPLRLTGWKRWLLLLTVPYLGALIMLAAFQRSLIYHPFAQKSLPANQAGLGTGRAHDITVRTEDNLDLRGWLVLAKGHAAGTDEQIAAEFAKGRPVVLYFGGNAGHRNYRQFEVEVLTQAGADVLIFDYRGYGDSPGDPSEEGLARDARAVWRFATEIKKIESRRIVLYGESLGGGVAIRLASELSLKKSPPAGVIVRSTFSSLTDAASSHFPYIPVRWLLLDRFPSEQRIRDVTCPLLQFHGRRDAIVPMRLGQKLFAAAPEKSESDVAKKFVELPNADHNDVMETSRREVLKAVSEFLPMVVAR
ncbi:MAG: alpha/beta hydrolase [Planctomycetaceae bacterium]|nr:alpha/beta hydrolase [Planctomycetaceae bacterium]